MRVPIVGSRVPKHGNVNSVAVCLDEINACAPAGYRMDKSVLLLIKNWPTTELERECSTNESLADPRALIHRTMDNLLLWPNCGANIGGLHAGSFAGDSIGAAGVGDDAKRAEG